MDLQEKVIYIIKQKAKVMLTVQILSPLAPSQLTLSTLGNIQTAVPSSIPICTCTSIATNLPVIELTAASMLTWARHTGRHLTDISAFYFSNDSPQGSEVTNGLL